MKIKQKLSQNRRDFSAIMICEHCNAEEKLTTGYDDTYYHEQVIPKMKCAKCGKTGLEFEQLVLTRPKYDDNLYL